MLQLHLLVLKSIKFSRVKQINFRFIDFVLSLTNNLLQNSIYDNATIETFRFVDKNMYRCHNCLYFKLSLKYISEY